VGITGKMSVTEKAIERYSIHERVPKAPHIFLGEKRTPLGTGTKIQATMERSLPHCSQLIQGIQTPHARHSFFHEKSLLIPVLTQASSRLVGKTAHSSSMFLMYFEIPYSHIAWKRLASSKKAGNP
jgi:hypothetical protein